MSRWWPVGANRLIDCEMTFADGQSGLHCLFPFFSGDGVVQSLLIIHGASGEARVLPAEIAIKIPLVGAVQVRAGWLELQMLETTSSINETWHFDPVWKMNEPELTNHPLRRELMATNCVEDFPWPVKNVYFDRLVRRVQWAQKDSASENTFKPFKPNMLPVAPTLVDLEFEARPRGESRWVLAPIWEANRGR